jgi:NAD(P)-dependent dehydrogenase (short-subunit alcohol dehydrogenase family)
VHQIDPDDWERVMAVNVTAPFLLTRALVPAMLDRGRGAIVTTASGAGLRGGGAGAAYTASKHAVIGLTRNVAWSYAGRGIRANVVCPGAVATAISADQPPRDPEAMALWQPIIDLVPRRGEPEEVAALIAYLASDDASFVNGAVVTADGGWDAA